MKQGESGLSPLLHPFLHQHSSLLPTLYMARHLLAQGAQSRFSSLLVEPKGPWLELVSMGSREVRSSFACSMERVDAARKIGERRRRAVSFIF